MNTGNGRCLVILAMGLAAAIGPSALGQIWTGGGGNANWTTAANWNPGLPPNNGTAAPTFSGTNGLSPNLNVNFDIAALNFTPSAGPFVMVGPSTLTLHSGGIFQASPNTQTINHALSLFESQPWTAFAGVLAVNGNVAGIGALIKTGGGTLVLAGTNTYTGSTTIEDGTLEVSNVANNGLPSNLGAGSSLTLGGGATDGRLRFTGASDATNRTVTVAPGGATIDITNPAAMLHLSGVTSGSGDITKVGPGTLRMKLNAFGGALAVEEGTFIVGQFNPAPFDVVIAAGAVLQVAETMLIGNPSGAGHIALGPISLFTRNQTDTVFSGTIDGGGLNNGFIKDGPGTLTLGGSCTPGLLEIDEGTLQVSSAASLGGPGTSLALFGTTLRITGPGFTTDLLAQTLASAGGVPATVETVDPDSFTTLAGVVAGDLLRKTGNGTLVLPQATTLDGADIVAGRLLVNNPDGSATGAQPVMVRSGATLGGSGAIAGTTTVETGGQVSPGASVGTLTLNGGLTMQNGARLGVELGAGGSDLLRLTSGQFLANGSVLVSMVDAGGLAAGQVHTLIDWTGATAIGVSAGDFVLDSAPAGVSGTFAIVGDTLRFTVTGAPALVNIVSANPPLDNPFVAGTQPYRDVLDTGAGATLTAGIGAAGTPAQGGISYAPISVTFSAAPSPAPAAGNVVISCTAGACPGITGVSGAGAGPFLIMLSGPIPPGQCTTLTFAGTHAGQKLQYQSQPGNVNQDTSTNSQDLLALIQGLNNGAANQAGNLARYNVNRSTGPNPVNTQDLLRLIQLLNGVNTTEPFNGDSVAACP